MNLILTVILVRARTSVVTAHATTNALIAVAVLAFHQWQLW